ncbi:hypothetical protein INS49_004376 [Diaporthe citri]|uniref:uncharacterized protein n=1 Tax=Diaporthe citri TaxID=83186 RepID=UPI001C7F7705|nr:uncharacterized protein INS49_004376 [Diaporthe citri]KAG6354359.1 hypothetical protein INS49_004376 [Diaporthe citri]
MREEPAAGNPGASLHPLDLGRAAFSPWILDEKKQPSLNKALSMATATSPDSPL